jgi:hypothetical protein
MVKLHRARADLIDGARASSVLVGIYGGILRFARQEQPEHDPENKN